MASRSAKKSRTMARTDFKSVSDYIAAQPASARGPLPVKAKAATRKG
jgi:hypothetical protein